MNTRHVVRSFSARLRSYVGLGKADPAMFSAINFDEKDFLGLFKLESVNIALSEKNIEGACEALVEHYRNRCSPKWPVFPARMIDVYTLSSTDVCVQADLILENRFQLAEEPEVKFEDQVDWNYNPTSDKRGRWTRELHRHRWIPILGVAYELTGDENYAKKFVELVCDWVHKNPPPSQKNEGNVAWTLMGVGMRCTVWVTAFSIFFKSPSFNRDSKLLMLRSIYDHARFLYLFKTHNNHLLRESNGLAYIAAFFPEFREADSWKNTVIERVEQELLAQLNIDGSHIEMSTAYQWLVAEELEGSLDLLESVDWTLENADLRQSLEKIYAVLAYTCRPDRTWPQLSDGFLAAPPELVERLLAAASRFGRQDFLELMSADASHPAVKDISFFLPHGGLAVMRSDWSRSANYLLMDVGPFGGMHGHEDKLSIEVCAHGEPFIVDPGTYTYNARDPFRAYFVSSSAHNTVLVDGMSQVRRWQAKHRNPQAGILEKVDWISEESFDFVRADYADGYGEYLFLPPKKPRIVNGITHRRSVLYVKPEYWIIVDEMMAVGRHDYQRMFQCAPDIDVSTCINGVNLRSRVTGHSLKLICSESENILVSQKCGSENPISGWVSDGRRNHKQPATQVSIGCLGSGPTTLVTLLYPETANRMDVSPTIRSVPLQLGEGLGICVNTNNGEDWYLISGDNDSKCLEGFTTDARVAGFHRSNRGGDEILFECL